MAARGLMTDCTAGLSKHCGSLTDASYVCPACTTVLRNDLRELPDLADELETTLSRQRGTDYANQTGGHGGEKPLPIHAGASTVRDVLKNTLGTWARVLCEQGGRYSGSDDAASIARWLLANLAAILRSDWAPECADEIHAATGEVRRCVDIPAEKVWLGPCNQIGRVGVDGTPELPTVAPNGPCGIVYAHEHDEWARCNTCGATFDVAKRQAYVSEVIGDSDDLVYTPGEIAHIVSVDLRREVTSAAVRGVIHRNRSRLQPPDHDGRYVLGEVRALFEKRQKASA